MRKFLFFLFLSLPLISLADSSYTVKLLNRHSKREDLASLFEKRKNFQAELNLSLRGAGLVSFKFKRGEFNKDLNALFLRGKSYSVNKDKPRKGRLHSSWASAVIQKEEDGDLKVRINFPLRRQAGSVRFYQAVLNLSSSKDSYESAPEFALARKSCASDLLASHATFYSEDSSATTASLETAAAITRVLELATDTDSPYTSIYGSATAAKSKVAAHINTATAIYENQFGLQLSIKKQTAQTSSSVYPTSITDSVQLLEYFANRIDSSNPLGAADAYFLFTGRNLDGDTVGIAYVGEVCRSNNSPYGVVQTLRSNTLDALIFAHELGHSLNADHTSSGIMSAVLNENSPPSTFNSQSVSEITSFINSYGSCLSAPSSNPTPTPIPTNPGGGTTLPGDSNRSPEPTMSFSFRNPTFTGRVTLLSAGTSCTVKLRAASTFDKARRGSVIRSFALGSDTSANFSGRFSKRLSPARSGTFVYIIAENSCSNMTSTFSNVKRINPARISTRSGGNLSQVLRSISATF